MKSSIAASSLVLLLTFSSLPVTLTFFLEWGPDLEGPWCAQRPPGQDCCDGRDDYCAVPILGTECYCDIFCNETAYDCCPDFWAHCFGVTRATTTPRPVVLPTPRTTRRPLETVRCELDGVNYLPGDKVQLENCNECTCELDPGQPGRVFGMRCTDEVCLVRPEIIDAVNDGPYTWRASNYSAFWGQTLGEGVRYRLGTYPLESDVVRMTPIKVREDESLPERFDAREKWPDLLTPVRDQGNCASSWAFSTTAVASDRLAIESEGAIKVELSPQHMLSCDTDGQDGCTGGKVDRAWYFLRKFGVVTEQCYPYDSGKTSWEGSCSLPLRQVGAARDCPSGIQYKTEKRYKATPPYRIMPREREIMKEIMINGPVQAIFEVREDFFVYKSGVYQYTGVARGGRPDALRSGNHSARIMGWGVDRTPEGDIIKYWVCDNSWGQQWGENGYFRIARGINANGIESNIVGVWGKVTGDVALRRLLAESRRRRLREHGAGGLRRRLRRRRRHHDHAAKKLRSLLTGRRRGRGRGRRHRGSRDRRQRKGWDRRRRNRNSSSRKNGKKNGKDFNKKHGRRAGRIPTTTTMAPTSTARTPLWEEVIGSWED